jgi:hypothetical protein
MMFKALGAATLLAFSSMAMAQSSTSGSSVGGVDVTKCSGLTGEEREKCLREQRSGASGGATTTTSPGIATTTPAPLTTPGSPTNPTTLPGSSTTPSGK